MSWKTRYKDKGVMVELPGHDRVNVCHLIGNNKFLINLMPLKLN